MERLVKMPKLASDIDIADYDLQWLWLNKVIKGGITILHGDAGLGKSKLLADISARILMQREMPDGEIPGLEGINIMYFTSEISIEEVVMNYKKHGTSNKALGRITIYDESYDFAQSTQMNWLRQQMLDKWPCLVLLDPLNEYYSVNENVDAEVRLILSRFNQTCKATGGSIIGLKHWNKNNTVSDSNRMSGSSVYRAYPRSVLMVIKQKDHVELKIDKSSYTGQGAPVMYRVIDPGVLEWFKESKSDTDIKLLITQAENSILELIGTVGIEVRLAHEILGKSFTKSTIYRALGKLRKEGKVASKHKYPDGGYIPVAYWYRKDEFFPNSEAPSYPWDDEEKLELDEAVEELEIR